jgi:hypothetical protein
MDDFEHGVIRGTSHLKLIVLKIGQLDPTTLMGQPQVEGLVIKGELPLAAGVTEPATRGQVALNPFQVKEGQFILRLIPVKGCVCFGINQQGRLPPTVPSPRG